ncbi:hypothetical protein CAPTEDRAFT_107961, partial [Capitella teleta]
SFSAMKTVKSYMRSAMCQDRLLCLSLLYVEESLEINTEKGICKFSNSDQNRRIILT